MGVLLKKYLNFVFLELMGFWFKKIYITFFEFLRFPLKKLCDCGHFTIFKLLLKKTKII